VQKEAPRTVGVGGLGIAQGSGGARRAHSSERGGDVYSIEEDCSGSVRNCDLDPFLGANTLAFLRRYNVVGVGWRVGETEGQERTHDEASVE